MCVAGDTDENGNNRVTLLKTEGAIMFKNTIPMNLQYFAESNGNGEGQEPTTPPTQPPAAGPEIDYDKIQQMPDGTLAAKETTALKAYFKQHGLSQEEAEQAITAFKEQRAANQPDVNAIQQNLTAAQQQAQQATIERDAFLLSGDLGIELKTMPYVLKMADTSQVIGEDGKVEQEKLKEALNKVLEDVPQLKPQADAPTGFRQIGVGQQTQQPTPPQTQQKTVPTKRWNRFN